MDPRIRFISRIDLSKSRVRAFEGFIFLCGGAQGKDPMPLQSVRHMIYHELTSGRNGDLSNRLKMAEEIQDWYGAGNYTDLLTFEEHLAGLSAVIVLVVEGPGAIAELGAFSMSDAFLERLLVVVAEFHYESTSFIRFGPIKRIENFSADSVLVYDWHEADYAGRLSERYDKVSGHMEEVVSAIRNFTSPARSERLFKKTEPSHVMFLICDICEIFGALNQTEIKEYLASMGVALNQDDIDRYLFLLEKCDLLRIKAQGHGRYYYPPDSSTRVSFGFTPGDHIDRDRVRFDVVAYYEKELPSRHEALRKIGGGKR